MNRPTTYLAAGAHCAPASASLSTGAVTLAGEASERLELTIAGMTCGHCVRAVVDTLEDLPGIEVDHVRIGHALLRFDPATANPAAVIEAIRGAGYQASFEPGTGAGADEQLKAGLPQAATSGGCCASR